MHKQDYVILLISCKVAGPHNFVMQVISVAFDSYKK